MNAQTSYEFGENYRIVPVENVNQKFPFAEYDSYGTLHIVWVNQVSSNLNVYYAQSVDGGISFSEPVRMNSNVHTIVAYMQSGPKIAIRGNEIVVLFMDDRSGYTSIYINASPDGGISWAGDLKVSDQPYLNAYPEFSVGIDNELHLVYYSYNQNYSLNSVRYSISPQYSSGFSPSVPVGITSEEMEPCDCCQPDVVVANNGDLFIGYRNNISNQRKHYIVSKLYGEDDFHEPVPISSLSDVIANCPSSGPSLSIEGNQIASGFYVSQQNKSYINNASLESLTFTSEVNVYPGSTSQQNFPKVFLKESTIHTIWIDYRDGNPDIYYAAMELGTSEVTNEQKVNDSIEDFVHKDPFLMWGYENLYSFWSDNRTGDYQIYMSSTGMANIESITVTNLQGWNLVGLPVEVENSSGITLYPESIEGTLYSFSGGYNLETNLSPGEGYWLRFNYAGSTTIAGAPMDELTISLNEGWNLISGITQPVYESDIQDSDGIIISGTLYSFAPEGYTNSEILVPGKGYWIRANNSGTIILISN